MLSLSILGFLAEQPLHAYELRNRISGLSGHIRPVSDGALYPALDRLRRAGFVVRNEAPGSGAARRQVFTLTDAGTQEFLRRLSEPTPVEITDRDSFMILLAFLGRLDDPAAQLRVLRRRLSFYDRPASYFYVQGRPLRADEMADRFRRGMITTAAAAKRADVQWLRAVIAELEAEIAGRVERTDRVGRVARPDRTVAATPSPRADRTDRADRARKPPR
ncbi:PadR family transcriptional regulator [Streptomyces fuscigenes]|uniref:PadR family transcriptional regulator n=1 Tax=Streptomyces fuscigenes TaxID=1528880 RepID=UPI0027DFD491|nr:PadR family transcriptional regulator [Streptomyces fuscigenes]